MDVRKCLNTLHIAEKLKNELRHCTTSTGRAESVAEHSWRLALMAFFLQDEFPELDMNKVIRMCLIHDLGECFTGDIPTFRKTSSDEKRETDALFDWVASLPHPYDQEMTSLYQEMGALATAEAKLYKALDKMEAVLQHNESPLSTWEPLEYDLNRTYGEESAACHPYLKSLRQALRADTDRKLQEGI